MQFTRDSAIWWLAIAAAIVGYLNTVKTPPTQWDYMQWLNATFFALSTIAAKLGTSPLRSSVEAATASAKVDLTKTTGVGIVVLALALGSVSCGARTYHIATVSAISAHTTLAFIQDAERAAVCGALTAPAPPACIPQDKHREIAAALAVAFDADGKLASIIRAAPVDAPLPPPAVSLLASVESQISRVLSLFPAGAVKDALLSKIGGVR